MTMERCAASLNQIRSATRFVLPIILTSAVLGLGQSRTAKSNQHPFRITIRASSEVLAGTQADLEIKVLNTSDETIVARSGFQAYDGDPTYEYVCHDSAGKLVSKEIAMVGSVHDPPLLKPGETYTSTVLLNRVCDISRPGRYEIQLYRGVPMGRPEYLIKSNKITLDVVPPLSPKTQPPPQK
jgi:hypothetical protein